MPVGDCPEDPYGSRTGSAEDLKLRGEIFLQLSGKQGILRTNHLWNFALAEGIATVI